MWRVELRRVARRLPVVRVEDEVVEASLLARDRDDPSVDRDPGRRLGDVHRRVDLAALQGGDHRVAVAEDAEDDLVDGDLPAPEIGVRLHSPELALLPLGQGEGTGPTPSRAGYSRHLVRRDVLPDVLRNDVERERRQPRIVDLRGHDDRALVGRLRGEIGDRRGVVQPVFVPGAVNRVRDVLGGQRRVVRPLEPLAERVRVRPSVVRGLPDSARLGMVSKSAAA